MPDSETPEPDTFTPAMAEKLPDKELKIGHEQAEQVAASENDYGRAAEAEHKADIAEDELKRRGTALN